MLEVGTLQETVTVTGAAPLIETSNASTGGTLDREVLETLPAPGRNAFLIGITVPTVMTAGDPQFNRQQDQSNASLVSLGGGGIRANNYLLDGVPITELTGRAVLNPTIEAVEEVKVQVHTYDAEMGRTGGGVFNVTARSGTNEFHGSGFYQTRPVWGVNENFFVEKTGQSKEESGLSDTYYRLYGGGIGGPIVRNRTFFWGATEGYRSNTTRNEQQIWPGLRQRVGDFSASTVGGVPVSIYNPYCRGGAASAKCPATGTGSLATGGLFTGADHPAHPPGRQRRRLRPARRLADRVNRRPDCRQREQPAERRRRPARSSTRPTCSRSRPSTSSPTRWSLSGLYIYNKTDEPGSTIMKPEAVVHRQPGQLLRSAAPPAARRGGEQHQHPERHHGADAPLRLLHLAGLLRQAALHRRASGRSGSARTTPTRCRRPTSSPSCSSTTSSTSAAGARFPTAGTAPTRSTPRCPSCGATTA